MDKKKKILLAVIFAALIPVCVFLVFAVRAPSARIALVIDDFGYNTKNVDAFLGLKAPVTFSILPNLPYSGRICEKALKEGQQVILHLPLEPEMAGGGIKPEKDTIYTGMTREEVLSKLKECADSVPGCVGASNHQGSKATKDKALMRVILAELKKNNLFFLDSVVTRKSVCEELAGELDMKFAKRDIFLDNKKDPEYIRSQLWKLVEAAGKKGSAIGIAHDNAVTAKVLSELIPVIEKEGIRFVFLSEVAD